MAFLETPRFPDYLSAWAVGGRGFSTVAVETYGGFEYRNAAWAQARGTWDISQAWGQSNPNAAYAIKTLRDFFKVSFGRLNGFRFRDPLDYLDEGHGAFIAAAGGKFQMVKNYTVGAATYQQIISKPLTPVVLVGGGTLDYATGLVTGGAPTSWTGAFDIPCRFSEDMPQMGQDSSGAFIAWNSLKIVEIRI